MSGPLWPGDFDSLIRRLELSIERRGDECFEFDHKGCAVTVAAGDYVWTAEVTSIIHKVDPSGATPPPVADLVLFRELDRSLVACKEVADLFARLRRF